jgi:predicted nucleic acid-binding protein
MKAVFADTFFYLAFVSEEDEAHEVAIRVARKNRSPVVTTTWVLAEVGDALAAPGQREVFLWLLADLRSDKHVTIVPPTQEQFDAGVELFSRRMDKEWSLTDCISFVVMNGRGIQDALTGDRHFGQAGFNLLLRT